MDSSTTGVGRVRAVIAGPIGRHLGLPERPSGGVIFSHCLGTNTAAFV
jgi:hypothetical protein